MENTRRLSPAEINNLSFEEAFERLNETAGKLERGNLSLEESLSLYEEGVLLSRYCENLLDKAELRVSQVSPSSLNSEEEWEPGEEDGEDFTEDAEDDFI